MSNNKAIQQKKYYDNNKDKILESKKALRTKKKIILMADKCFPLCIIDWYKINKKSISLVFTDVNSLKNFIKLKGQILLELCECRVKYNSVNNIDKIVDMKLLRESTILLTKEPKLKALKVLLQGHNFPTCLAVWANINKTSITISLTSLDDLENFTSIIDLIEMQLYENEKTL